MKRASFFLSSLLLALPLFYGCPDKKTEPPPPPQELLDAMDAARSTYDRVSALAPDHDVLETYKKLMDQARQAMDRHDYDTALDKALRARLALERLHARLIYEELMEKYDPSSKLTYHFRQKMSRSQAEEKKGDLEAAIKAAVEARKQAELAVDYEKQCLEKGSERLAELKKQIENLYRPPFEIIELYWRARHLVDARECASLDLALDKIKRLVRQEKETMVYSYRRYEVHADDEYMKRYGKPAMFESVTSKGLVKVINRVRPGKEVIFIRGLLYTPSRTYYLVKDPETGIKGWMAEERVWPERARKMKKLGSRYGS